MGVAESACSRTELRPAIRQPLQRSLHANSPTTACDQLPHPPHAKVGCWKGEWEIVCTILRPHLPSPDLDLPMDPLAREHGSYQKTRTARIPVRGRPPQPKPFRPNGLKRIFHSRKRKSGKRHKKGCPV